MNENLHQRLAQFTDLDCKVAKRFSDRPPLLDVAAQMLVEQWQQRGLDQTHTPLNLFLASRQSATRTWIRPLPEVLVERFCNRQTLNLTHGEDFLTTRMSPSDAWQVDIDLGELELLINETAPFLIDIYKQRLVEYWNRFDRNGISPWTWYVNILRDQMHEAIEACRRERSLSDFALSVANLVHTYPSPEQRTAWSNTGALKVSTLSLDFSADARLDVDLCSALLIEHDDSDPQRKVTLLYTLDGELLSFDSRQALLTTLDEHWPSVAKASPRQVHIVPTPLHVFEQQALGLLTQQLRIIEHVAGLAFSRLDALSLPLDLDRLTSMVDLCSDAEAAQRQPLTEQLPDWLRNAPSRPLLRYSTWLIDVAQSYQDANGQFWLDGIETGEAFANQQLAARMAADHPGESLLPEHVRIVNYQTTAVAAPGQGSIVTSGEITPVTFSFAQLAIGNLGLLAPGRVVLSSTTETPLPTWMTEDYLRTLVSELDIASRYPAMLRSKLLDDAPQRADRERLLTQQLRSQLPALAMEQYLRGELQDAQAPEHIAELFSPAPHAEGARWVLRALGFIKEPGSAPDHPRNTWLIEPNNPSASSCLLYRPLHTQSLLWFRDRLALLVAISTPGELQDDLLQRLPAQDRRFYAHGGFVEPHLFVPLDDTSAVPLSTPAPVTLALGEAVAEPGTALYLACVHESIERFREHATTSAQTRWNSWKELGWLLFNTLLPLAGSTLGKVAWLAQMEVALASYVEGDNDPTRHRLAMVDLLVNIAMLLFNHSIFRWKLEKSPAPLPQDPALLPSSPEAPPQALPQALPVLNEAPKRLDLSWASALRQLDAPQRAALERLQAPIEASTLGSPAPSGPLQGLYPLDLRLYTLIDGKVYEVLLDNVREQMRIVGPDQTQGPWLLRDEVGRWHLDLRLRLQGGQPLSEQMRKMRLKKANDLETANALIKADQAVVTQKTKEMVTIEALAGSSTEDSVLARCQDKIVAVSDFWKQHLEHLKQRNELQVVKEFKRLHAQVLHQSSFSLRVLHRILRKRYQPQREQLLQVARLQQEGTALSPDDVAIATRRLDLLTPLLDQMIQNNSDLHWVQRELGRLASVQQPDIREWSRLANSVDTSPAKALILRYLRLEGLINRLTLVHGLNDQASRWFDRFWDTIQLAIGQRAVLDERKDLDDEVRVRLLRSLSEQYRAATRQLEILSGLVEDEAAAPTLDALKNALAWFVERSAFELAELPDYPPTRTLRQMSNRVPGLIETDEHGLLLAEPRQDDENTVDVPGPDNKTPGHSYHLKHGQWVEIRKAPPRPPRPEQKLKHLLQDSTPLMNRAREQVQQLTRSAASYLPVEVEELVQHERTLLLERADDIEHNLTTHNLTDDARQGLDAEGVARSLRTLATELTEQARQMRITAALAHKPSMGDVQFLLEQGQVTIRAEGTRTQLAKVAGRPADFIDEYSINHQGTPLWYAHFHYRARDSLQADFTVGHLKTAAQRFQTGNTVYYKEITHAAAQRFFFIH